MAQRITTTGICLKRYAYRDTSSILHVLTPQQGVISVLAKGLKRKGSRLSGAGELLHLSQLSLVRGRNLDILSQYQSINAFGRLRENLAAITLANVCAELVYAIRTRIDVSPTTASQQVVDDNSLVFHRFIDTLCQLDQIEHCYVEPCYTSEALSKTDSQTRYDPTSAALAIVSNFHKTLLALCGLGVTFDHCVLSGQPVDFSLPAETIVRFSPQQGGVVLDPHVTSLPHTSLNTALNTTLTVPITLGTLAFMSHPLEGTAEKAQTPERILRFLDYLMSTQLEKRFDTYTIAQQLLTTPSVQKHTG